MKKPETIDAQHARLEHEQEIEANLFARCLLMPESLVKSAVKKMGGIDLTDDAQITALAKTFQVPVGVAAERVLEIYGK